jgi:Secretion system C-terminal sorting domain/FG-GAP repeat
MKRLLSISSLVLFPILCFGQWTQVGNSINGQAANDRCGSSTAISADGSIVAMGSPNSSSSFSNAGKVRVFKNTNINWTQIGADIDGESSGDQTGRSVSLSADGSILAIGEPFNNDLGFTSGQVRVFKNVNNAWSQVGQDLFGENASAEGGRSVDLSDDGSIVAFGAPNTTVNGMFFAGKVKVYINQNNTWVQKGGDINGDGSVVKFGNAVSLSADGNTIAIGQSGDPVKTNPEDTGRVKIYQFTGNQWVQLGNTIFEPGSRGEFGYQLSLSSSGTVLAIGSYSRSEVQVFELSNGTWSQIGSTLIGNGAGDAFGFSVSLSGSGTRLAVGARFINLANDKPGSAYIFERQGSNWVLIGNQIVGVAQGDQAGFSVAINQNGSKVAVASTGNDTAGNNAGYVRVFENIFLSTSDVENNLFSFYPNPVSDVVNFSADHNIENITIYNSFGQKVLAKKINSKNCNLDVSALSNGIYVVKLEGDKSKTVKLIKH